MNIKSYVDYKKEKDNLCIERDKAWYNSDWSYDDELSKQMFELEKQFPEYEARWTEETFERFCKEAENLNKYF
jgi:hypothetical protein